MTPEEDTPGTAANDDEDQIVDMTNAEAAPADSAVDGDPDAAIDPRVDEVLGDLSVETDANEPAEASGDQAAPAADAGDDVETRLAAAEARADDNWDRLLRLQADMENKNKRAQRDVQNARKFALETIANDLLPIKDSLEMGLAAADEEAASVASIREGSDLTLKMLASALEKHNIVEINPQGERFNPEFHQAMSMQPAGEGTEPNTVISVMQKGYTLNERLIRPALVMVAK